MNKLNILQVEGEMFDARMIDRHGPMKHLL